MTSPRKLEQELNSTIQIPSLTLIQLQHGKKNNNTWEHKPMIHQIHLSRIMGLRKRDPYQRSVKCTRMLTNKRLSRSLFTIKGNQSLPLTMDLKKPGVYNNAMLTKMSNYVILCHITRQWWYVYRLCWCSTVPIVLARTAVETAQAWVCIVPCIRRGSYVRVLGEGYFHLLAK